MSKAVKTNTSNTMQELAAQSKKNYEKVARKMRIAAEIADAMDSSGLSKIQFAERMHKKPSVITKWLSGTHNFTTDTLTEISTELGVVLTGMDPLMINSRRVNQSIKTTWGIKPTYHGSFKSDSIAGQLCSYINYYEPIKQFA